MPIDSLSWRASSHIKFVIFLEIDNQLAFTPTGRSCTAYGTSIFFHALKFTTCVLVVFLKCLFLNI